MPPRALIFDVFGTPVDWRNSVAREVAVVAGARGWSLDPHGFASDWRAEYDPAMKRIRDGGRGYVPLEVLHRKILDRVLAARGLELDPTRPGGGR